MQYARLPPSIFLSYARTDEKLAGALSRELTARGAVVWTDVEQLRPGDRWRRRIEEAIRQVDVFLLLITPASQQSSSVQSELALALDTAGKTKVVPVRVGGADVPARLTDIVWLDADQDDLAATAELVLSVADAGSMTEGAIADEVVRALDGLGVSWQREPTVAGVRPDFLVESADGHRLVIEVKSRANPSLVQAIDARTQAARMRDLTGSEAALVVFPELQKALPSAGIVGLGGVHEYVQDLLQGWVRGGRPAESGRAGPRPEPDPGPPSQLRTVFAAMPFKADYDDVYWVAMTAAAEAVGAACVRIDREDFEGDIAIRICELIRQCTAMIADLSESNPNVLYEVGYAHALRRPCVSVCSTPLADLPFDVRNLNTLAYSKGRTWALREPLINRLQAALEE